MAGALLGLGFLYFLKSEQKKKSIHLSLIWKYLDDLEAFV